MPAHDQVLRFAVGSATGPRSRTWRLWVPKRKSDVYVSGRRVGNSVKVSLHEPGPSRFALTSEFIRRGTFKAPHGRDPRLAVEWERPRPTAARPVVRPFTLIVPWDEVVERDVDETGGVVWTPPPPPDTCVHFDLIYVLAGTPVPGHPGARSMGTALVGTVLLDNGDQVFVTSLVRPMEAPLRAQIQTLRSARIIDAAGNPIAKTGMLAFGTEPNPDADDGTFIGHAIDVTRPDEADEDASEQVPPDA